MTVIVLERVTPGLRGLLTRWMLEIRAGVFVGKLSARVRGKLWVLVCESKRKDGSCLLLYSSLNEQGFTMVSSGDPTRDVADFDGLLLLRREIVKSESESQ